MITAKAVLDKSSCLKKIDVDGHAAYAEKGEDILCSAVTVLVRTAGKVLLAKLTDSCEFRAEERGSFHLEVERIDDGEREWMKGVTEFFLNGLSDLSRDFPAHIKLDITIDEEMIHGS